MHRANALFATAVVLGFAACGAEKDDRARNLDYITEAILKPSCGQASCHSAFRQEQGYAFDSIDGARNSFQADEILVLPSDPDQRDAPAGLVLNLTLEQPGAPRMPYYEPMPDKDVELIGKWLHDGASGTCKGAMSCLGPYIVPCGAMETYELDLIVPTLDVGLVTDCGMLGALMVPAVQLTCRNAACVQVTQ